MTAPSAVRPAGAPIGPPGAGRRAWLDPAKLLPVAWPGYFELIAGVVAGIISVFWVARLGIAELGAVTVATSLENLLLGVILGVGVGTTVTLARSVGAEEYHRLGAALRASLWVTLTVATGTCAILFVLREPLARLMLGSGSGRTMRLAVDYLTVSVPGVSVFFGQQVLDGVFKASGNTRTPMRMAVLSNALLLVLDPVLIFGWLGAPRLGVTGSAIALVAARSVALGVTWLLYLRSPLRAKARAGALAAPPAPAEAPERPALEILRAGWPVSADFLARMGAATLVVGIIARFGPDPLAAYGAVTKAMLFLTMASYALRQAATIVAAQATGSKDEQLLKDTRTSSLRLGLAWSVISGLLVLLGAGQVARLLTHNASVGTAADALIPWMALYAALLLCNVALSGIFFGGGKGRLLAYATLAGVVAQSLLAPLLSSTALGLTGVWVAMVANVGTQVGVLVLLSARGPSAAPGETT
ncbi:putative MATE family efflux protein [Kitasatospora sp. MAA4]|uniref:MATE family efflux transporter n=1 Tax=Kitasatospora sp. MAA4 TaxID=3035093 RepID=UPI00247319E3|nr:MATE family efflux transporter [Kitasatospora sp. MAA4]MDH6131733.1 putative MATE family efflux protein [Kitasatospora sp. MAA4]